MTRRLLNLLTALSLLLFVAVVVLWVRSYHVRSVFGYQSDVGRDGWYRCFSLCSRGGRITLVLLHSKFDRGLARGGFHAWEDARSVTQAIPGWAGFGYRSVQGRETGWTEIQMPHWFAAALLGVWPVARCVRARWRKSDPGGFPVTGPYPAATSPASARDGIIPPSGA